MGIAELRERIGLPPLTETPSIEAYHEAAVAAHPPPPPEPPTVTFISPIPLPIIGQFPTVTFNGLPKIGLVPIQEIFRGPEPEEVIIYPSPVIPIEPKIGEEVPVEYVEAMEEVLGPTPGTPFPITPPIEFQWPDLPEFKFPDIFGGLKTVGTYGLMAGALILGYLVLTRKK